MQEKNNKAKYWGYFTRSYLTHFVIILNSIIIIIISFENRNRFIYTFKSRCNILLLMYVFILWIKSMIDVFDLLLYYLIF